MLRHFSLTVGDPARARRQLGRLVSGDEADAPQITTAEDWHVGFGPGPGDDPAGAPRHPPDYCLNVGITWPGLVALGIQERVPTLAFSSFGAFVEGAAERASLVGDTGASAPQNWTGGFGGGDDHLLVTLHAISPESMTSHSDRLSAWFAEDDAFREIWRKDGMALMEMQDGVPVPRPKFISATPTASVRPPSVAARSGISQITSSPASHGSSSCGKTLRTTRCLSRVELGLNGSFAVFKQVETDVVGFEDFLQSKKDQIDPELLAAKLCGRWRNGVPLALSPDTDSPEEGMSRRPVE